MSFGVAPVRERGLKCKDSRRLLVGEESRSRKGAWIEIIFSLSL